MDMSRTRSFIMLNKILCRCKGCNRSTIHCRSQGQISPRCREFKFRFKLLIFLLLQWPPFRRINILLQTLPTLPSSCHWSRQCCARLGFLLGMRLATVSHTKRKLQCKLEKALSIKVDFQETFLSLQTTAILDVYMAPATLKREHRGAENHTTVFPRWLEFGIFVLSLLEIDCTLKWRWMFGICKSWMIVLFWGIQACKLLV